MSDAYYVLDDQGDKFKLESRFIANHTPIHDVEIIRAGQTVKLKVVASHKNEPNFKLYLDSVSGTLYKWARGGTFPVETWDYDF